MQESWSYYNLMPELCYGKKRCVKLQIVSQACDVSGQRTDQQVAIVW